MTPKKQMSNGQAMFYFPVSAWRACVPAILATQQSCQTCYIAAKSNETPNGSDCEPVTSLKEKSSSKWNFFFQHPVEKFLPVTLIFSNGMIYNGSYKEPVYNVSAIGFEFVENKE